MDRLIVRADRSDNRDSRKAMVTSGLEAGICRFILRKEDDDFEDLGKMDAIYVENDRFIDDSFCSIDIDSPESQRIALSMAGKKNVVLITTSDWTIIPLENIIAGFSESNTMIYACTSEISDAKLILTVMEKGVDGIVIDVDDPLKIQKFTEVLSKTPKEDLSEITIKSVMPVEMGDRVCIDTCSMMPPGEGMLIGSYSNCLFLIQSESEENGYVASRPFRVNAGAVHSYIQVPGGSTKYISEIKSGDSVLLCDKEGRTRSASVGRCKIEKRPLLMITATDGHNDYSVILQNAETIKLVGREGAVSVTKIEEGDKVLAKICTGGRHFGMAIEETISEK